MKHIISSLGHSGKVMISNAPEGVDALVAIEVAQEKNDVLFILRDEFSLNRHSELLTFFAPELRVIQFPAWDTLPYDRISPRADIIEKRINALGKLIQKPHKKRIVLTTVSAVMQRIPSRKYFNSSTQYLRVGSQISISILKSFLFDNCYERVDTVYEPGEFALRGGIVDLFPSGHNNPIRLDYFGDEIEKIRVFDPLNQRTINNISEVIVGPASEFQLDEGAISRFQANYWACFGKSGDDDQLYQAVSEKRRYAGIENWLPLFHSNMQTIFDYLPNVCVIFDYQSDEAIAGRHELINDYYSARCGAEEKEKKIENFGDNLIYRPLPPQMLYLEKDEFNLALSTKVIIFLNPFDAAKGPDSIVDAGGRIGHDFGDVRVRNDIPVYTAVRQHLCALVKSRKRPLIAANSEGSRDRLVSLMREYGVTKIASVGSGHEFWSLDIGTIGIAVLAVGRGFLAGDVAVISEEDILGERLVSSVRRSIKPKNFVTEANSLVEEELVVHVEHGIGRFLGLKIINVGGAAHDCLVIEYADNNKLYLPVENVELISRFGSDDSLVTLDRLGSLGWQARKSKMKERIKEIASELIKVAAERELISCDPLLMPNGLYQEFSARFPYVETEDQKQAIVDTLGDLEKGRPTDRLICGDVGFGKTEVGLRAAFVVAMEGKQVAVVVPTTLLCRQHFHTFSERFKGFPIRVEQISRLVSANKSSKIKEDLADGSINIIIGTHALLSKSIKIQNLGLLVIDEEQRFGVSHKEELKKLRSDVHVLTLTATPIPRTLQLALAGIREMSIIASPPVDRLAVRTFILPFDRVVIREAIMREYFRGGQSFYVCPRISDLEKVGKQLSKIVPEIEFDIVHGQMATADIENTIGNFYDRKFDLLLTTNIIESGLDLPSVNTIIIHRSDMFGLAQLYQLRGRVGRAKIRSFAYLTLMPGIKLTPAAEKRLEVMKTLDNLGAGFSLASHDLDIRGAGNLLGSEQSGQIREVGIELYQNMLEEAVSNARGGDVQNSEKDWSPQVGIGLAVLIPDFYVKDLSVRMGLYRRLAWISTEKEIEIFAAELIDRFGQLPSQVENLLATIKLKQVCKKAGISRLDAGPRGAVVSFHNDDFPNILGLIEWLSSHKGTARLRPDQKLVFNRVWDTKRDRLAGVKYLVSELCELCLGGQS